MQMIEELTLLLTLFSLTPKLDNNTHQEHWDPRAPLLLGFFQMLYQLLPVDNYMLK